MTNTSLEKPTDAADSNGHEVATHAVPRYNPDAPSEEWGWHGSWRAFAPKGSSLLLWLGVFALFMQNFTEHESHVENYYFNAIALIGAVWLIMRARSGRKMRRRAHDSHQR